MFGNSVWELGTRVDHSGQYTPDELNGVCHPDARRLAEHVSRLSTQPINWSRDQRFLLGDLAAYLRIEDLIEMGLLKRPRAKGNGKIANARVSRDLVAGDFETLPELVKRCAVLGQPPQWDLGELHVKPVISRNGEPVTDGPLIRIDGKRTRTHCYVDIQPSAAHIAIARWDFWRYVSALETLALVVNDLEEYTPLPAGLPRTPWFSPQITQSRNGDSQVREELAHALGIQLSNQHSSLTSVK